MKILFIKQICFKLVHIKEIGGITHSDSILKLWLKSVFLIYLV